MAEHPSTPGAPPSWMTNVPTIPSQGSTASQLPPELTGHESQYFVSTGRTLIGITCMLLVLCTAGVIGRLVARRWAKATLQADDYASLLALFLFVVVSIENFLLAHYVFRMQGHGPPDLSPLRVIGHLALANGLTYGFLITVARCSVLLLYRRIFSVSHWSFKWPWWICLGLVLGYLAATLVGILRQCSPHPVSTLWQNPPKCHASNEELMIMGFLNAAVDICVLALPTRPVWKLQMPLGRRLMVCALFGLGLL
ncbi:MAG: hypothetical protein Q9170_003179 [Blastenia crenularia]